MIKKNMKIPKYLLFFFAILLFLNFVSAILPDCEFTIPNAKAGDCRELITSCSNCSFVNLTAIYYPPLNGTILYPNAAMTQNANTYNYTFCNTNVVGTYIYTVLGNPDGILDTGNICFQITQNGITLSGVDIVIYLIALAFFCFLVFFLGGRFTNSPSTTSKAIYFFLCWIFGFLPFIYLSSYIYTNYLSSDIFLSNIFDQFLFIVIILTFIVFIVCIGFIIIDLINTSMQKKLVKRGYSEDDASKKIKRRK